LKYHAGNVDLLGGEALRYVNYWNRPIAPRTGPVRNFAANLRDELGMRCLLPMKKLVKRAGRDKIEAVPDRIIVLKNAAASAQAADEANFRIRQSIPPRAIHQLLH